MPQKRGNVETGSEAARRRRDARIARLLKIDALLRDRQGVSIERLCEELAVCPRTLRRDIAILRSAGATLEYSRKKGGYRMSRHGSILAETLTTKQFAAVMALLEGLVPLKGSDFDLSLKIVLTRLRQCLAEDFPTAMEDVDRFIQEIRLRQSQPRNNRGPAAPGPLHITRGIPAAGLQQEGIGH